MAIATTVNGNFTLSAGTFSQGTGNTLTVAKNFSLSASTTFTKDAGSGTLTFNPGQTSKPVAVSITDDSLAEDDETFTLNLSNATGGLAIADGRLFATTYDGVSTTAWNTTPSGRSAPKRPASAVSATDRWRQITASLTRSRWRATSDGALQ